MILALMQRKLRHLSETLPRAHLPARPKGQVPLNPLVRKGLLQQLLRQVLV